MTVLCVYLLVGLELGPTKGASLGGVFFFLGAPPCFLSRASAAAARSARIFARSSAVKLGSTAAGGKSSSRFLLEELSLSRYWASSAVPRRRPCRLFVLQVVASSTTSERIYYSCEQHTLNYQRRQTHLSLKCLDLVSSLCQHNLLFRRFGATVSHDDCFIIRRTRSRSFVCSVRSIDPVFSKRTKRVCCLGCCCGLQIVGVQDFSISFIIACVSVPSLFRDVTKYGSGNNSRAMSVSDTSVQGVQGVTIQRETMNNENYP